MPHPEPLTTAPRGRGRPAPLALRPRALAAALLSSLAASALGCGGDPPKPRDQTPQQTAPDVKPQFVETDAPFIVDWDSAEVARLASAVQGKDKGAVVVASRRGVLHILPDCSLSGAYAPSPMGMYRGALQVRRGDSINRMEGVQPGALQQVATSENVAGDTLYDYRFVVVGRHDLGKSRKSAQLWDLTERKPGACSGATHFVRAALTGAFERATDPSAPGGLQGGAADPASQKMPAKAGNFTDCLMAAAASSPACNAFVKIELTALGAVRVELRLTSLKLEGQPVPGLQLVFRGKGGYRAATTPDTTSATFAHWVLPVAEITEDAPLIVEALRPGDRGPQAFGAAEIKPSDVRKAVFNIELRDPKNNTRAGVLQLTASEPAPAPAPAPSPSVTAPAQPSSAPSAPPSVTAPPPPPGAPAP